MKRTNGSDLDFQRLVGELDLELWGLYEVDELELMPHNKINDDAHVLVAYVKNIPVACGCFRRYSESVAEIKRMFTKPEHRGKGLAKMILASLEIWAIEAGISKMILETGVKQPAAITAYQKSGYSPIQKYGPYVDKSYSICMGKDLLV